MMVHLDAKIYRNLAWPAFVREIPQEKDEIPAKCKKLKWLVQNVRKIE